MDSNVLEAIACVAGAFAFVGSVLFFFDLRAHEGVTVFARRRVLRSGTAAPARILSDEMLDKSVVRFGTLPAAYSIVYEVLPPGEQPFRAKAIEVLTDVEHEANLRAGRGGASLGTDVSVRVKFDPKSHLVVLVRVDAKRWKKEQEAERRKATEALLRERPRG
jgi:hypothetical protein